MLDGTLRELLTDGLIQRVVYAIGAVVVFRIYLSAVRYYSYLLRLLPLVRRRFRWRPFGYQTVGVTIGYALIPPGTTSLPYYMVEEGDVRCLYVLHSLFGELFGRTNVSAINVRDLEAELASRTNLVLVSGPLWNTTMQLYLGLLGSPVRFDWDGDDLKLVDLNDTEYRSTYDENRRVRQCHGLILAGQINVAGVDQYLLIVAGCSNLSTYAGGVILSQLNINREMRRSIHQSKIHADRMWAIVFNVENWSSIDDPAMIPAMQTGALRISIKKTYREVTFVEPYEFRLWPRPQ